MDDDDRTTNVVIVIARVIINLNTGNNNTNSCYLRAVGVRAADLLGITWSPCTAALQQQLNCSYDMDKVCSAPRFCKKIFRV